MSSRIEWHGEEAIERVRGKAVRFVTSAAIIVERRAKQLLSLAGTAVSIGQGSKGKRLTGAVRSKPGEPPRKQTGFLRGHVTREVDTEKLAARVGTNYLVGMYLELGTKRGLLPRPWLRRALAESRDEIDGLEARIGDES